MIECSFCKVPATSGVDTVERDEYYNVCDSDLARLVSDHSMVAVALVVQDTSCGCGCGY